MIVEGFNMKQKLCYVKKIINVLVYPFIFMLIQTLVSYFFVCIFNNSLKMNSVELLDYMNTSEYKQLLNSFVSSRSLFVALIMFAILLPLLLFVYKKYYIKNDFKLKNLIEPIIFGITISLIYNIILYNFNNLYYFTDKFHLNNISIFVQILSSGIIGPILEELLFRGIVYNKLKDFNKPITSIILTSILFGLMHNNIMDVIYGFGVSFILIYLYEKYKTLKAPIVMHMFLNITIIVILPLISFNFYVFNMYLLIVSIFILYVCKKVCIK